MNSGVGWRSVTAAATRIVLKMPPKKIGSVPNRLRISSE
jgi:hypothetical protein